MNRLLKLSENSKIIKNLLAVNVAYVALFSSLTGTTSLQSVLLQEGCLGTISQSVIYSTQLLTSFVLPQVLINIVGFKWSILLAEILFLSFVTVQIFPRWAILLTGNNQLMKLSV
jgi:hypothetical protein